MNRPSIIISSLKTSVIILLGGTMNINFNPFPQLESKRLIFKPLEKEHIRPLFDYQSNKGNFEFVDMPVYTDIKQAKTYVTKMNQGVKDNKWIIWAICLKETLEIIGTISVWNLDANRQSGELGYGIFSNYRKQGYMSESIECIEAYAKTTMKLTCLDAYTSNRNKASRALLSKLSYPYVKTISEEGPSGTMVEMAVYTKVLDKS